ncbi:MAG TPA: SEC-C metal-binding domain-containing protein [Pseudonocardiaceae bacterium]|nr:SEC-C metal-binding domain-containing protein [Pseudonocardiaceae bacterium]
MDLEKIAFLFGEVPDGFDPDDPDERMALLTAGHGGDADEPLSLRAAIADQIASDTPPQVWQAAQRLLAEGRDRIDIMRQLVLALTASTMSVVEHREVDLDAYLTALDRLPVPSVADVTPAMIDIVRAQQGITADDLDQLLITQLGMPAGDPVTETLLDRVSDHVIGPDGALEMLAGDRLLHVESLTGGIVLTHRLSAAERRSGMLEVGIDLAGFWRRDELRLPGGGGLDVAEGSWVGPAGWLSGYPDGAVLAVRVDDGYVSITVLEAAPPVAGELVARLRTVYDEEIAEPGLPVTAEELVLGVLLEHRSAFAEPAAPLTELLSAAGLQTRGMHVAHDQSIWDNAQRLQRTHRVIDELGAGDRARAALRALRVTDAGVPDRAAAHEVLDLLYDPAVLEVVPGELLGRHDDPDLLAATGALVERLLAAANKPAHQAVAHWLAALVAERRGQVVAAESHLRVAVRADPGWPSAVDRLAWYAFDRGNATEALTMWRSLGLSAEVNDDVRALEEFAAPDVQKLGRNQPCWCGSGRKFTACHLGRPERAGLPDRVGWLCRKAAAYLERRGGAPREIVLAHAAARAADPDDHDSLHEALADPLVIDVVLHEGGWFNRFLADRGPLLPDDEALLARAWTLVERTVYEVVECRPGAGVTVRDLRTGDVLEVRERTFSKQARCGVLMCARAVPDGQSHQFIGGMFAVAPGRERDLLDLLDERDGLALLAYVADLYRPPVIVGPDGQVIELPPPTGGPLPPLPPASPELEQALRSLRDEQERRWCDENVPALGGITPREAAGDPTRRDELARLINSFPEIDPTTGMVGLRPARLRELLGLPSGTGS